ncbi:MAG: ABC transporter ATP-binding protein [Nitrospinota bacterium]
MSADGERGERDSGLSLEGVSKNFGGVQAIRDLSLRVPVGRIIGLIGPNGAGKTTVFNLVTGVYSVSGGVFRFYGEDITNERPHRIVRRGIARTFQNIRLFESMTVLQTVQVAQTHLAGRGVGKMLKSPGVRRQAQEARHLLEFVGLWGDRGRRATTLPYGAQRRLEIARALGTRPRLLLLDEPTAGMTAGESQDLLGLFRLLRARGTALFLIEHDMRVVMDICDYIYLLNFGELIVEGKPSEVQSSELALQAYLGVS